jgi:hypothetical protein
VSTVTGDDSVGYVLRAALMDPLFARTPITVFGDDLRTVVGHMYANKGFVPLGTDPEAVPGLPTTTTVIGSTTTLGGSP